MESLSADCCLMHRKVDQIASCLGIALYYLGMEQLTSGGSRRHASGRNVGAPQMVHNVDAVLQPSGRGLSGILILNTSMLP